MLSLMLRRDCRAAMHHMSLLATALSCSNKMHASSLTSDLNKMRQGQFIRRWHAA